MKPQKILLITPVCPYGHHGGHATRVRWLLETLQNRHDVWVLYAPFWGGKAAPLDKKILGTRLLEFPGVLVFFRNIIRKLKGKFGFYKAKIPRRGLLRHVDQLSPPFLSMIAKACVEKYEIETVLVAYVFLSSSLKRLPSHVHTVIDTHDEFGERFKKLDKNFPVPWPWNVASLSHEMEAEGLNRAKVSLAMQFDEAESFRSKGVRHCLPVPFVPSILPEDRQLRCMETPEKGALVYFGSSWGPNVNGLRWFLEEVFPQLRCRNPQVTLHVAGSVCDMIPNAPDGVFLLGMVDDIRAVVRSHRVFICPVFNGTGFNVKVLEALAWGMPFVVTTMALRGLRNTPGPELPVADDPASFLTQIELLLSSDKACDSLSQRALLFVDELAKGSMKALEDALGHGYVG